MTQNRFQIFDVNFSYNIFDTQLLHIIAKQFVIEIDIFDTQSLQIIVEEFKVSFFNNRINLIKTQF